MAQQQLVRKLTGSFTGIVTGIGPMIAAGVNAAVQAGIPRDTSPSATLPGYERGGINVIGQNVRIPHGQRGQRRAKKEDKKKDKKKAKAGADASGSYSGQRPQESCTGIRRGTGGGGGALSAGSKPLPALPPPTYRP